MGGLATPLADLPMGAQDPVHRRGRRQVDTLVEQLVVHGGRRLIHELLAVEQRPHRIPLGRRQRPRLRPALADRARRWRGLPVATVVVGLRPPGRRARGPLGAQHRCQLGDRVVDHGVGSLPLLGLSVAS